MNRISLGALAGLLLCACGGTNYGGGGGMACSAGSATPVTAGSTIGLAGTSFTPSCASTTAGTTLTFKNQDTTLHTVTARSGQPEVFDSGDLSPNATFSHMFNTTGAYHIVCTIHESMGMTMTLFVQ